MTAAPTAPEDVDLSDPDLYANGDPHAVWRFLRANAPVHKHPQRSGPGFWVITKHEDVRAVSRDPSTFISSGGTSTLDLEHADTASPDYRIMQGTLVITDPPRHTKLRALVNRAFTPQAVARLEPFVREVVTRIVDEAAGRGDFDLVADVAARLPFGVVCELVGVPVEDRRALFDSIAPMMTSRVDLSPDGAGGPMRAAFALIDYLRGLVESRAAEPRQDLVSGLVRAEVEGERLSMFDMLALLILLFIAGSETTMNAISGGVQAFFENPEERTRLEADRSLGPTAVEEVLRWTSPTMVSMVRTATRHVELRGQDIREGQKVTLWYGSANRDEEVFVDPDRFDVGRTPNDHLAFGHGVHFCLGAGLARLELRVTLEEVLRRMPSMEQTGPAVRLRSNIFNGVERMPVRVTPA